MKPYRILASALILIILSAFPAAFAEPLPSEPITAAPPLAVPNTPNCSVTIVNNQAFGPSGGPRFFTPFIGTYSPPAACQAPWAEVVLKVSFNVTQGRQFDRAGALWIGSVEIFRTTTAEPSKTLGPVWTVEKDVSQYEPILTQNQTVAMVISNIVTGPFTSIIYGTATLTFYEPTSQVAAAQHPDKIIPISRKATPTTAPWFQILKRASANVNVTLPTNLVSAQLEVYATAHSCDEFWYANQPTDYAVANGLCGGTAFREIQILIDGSLSGVIWPFPFIYTGGINPFLWRPIPAVNAFNIPAYTVDLTPFVGTLTNGQPHTISFRVFNNYNYWLVDANLLLFQDHVSSSTTGSLVTNSLQPTAGEQVASQINPISALFNTTASRTSVITGFVDTSTGRVTTTIQQSMSFTNNQVLNLLNGLENLRGTETITTTTTTSYSNGTTQTETIVDSYPIAVTSSFIIPIGTANELEFILPATVHQEQDRTTTTSTNSITTFQTSLSDSIDARALLVRTSTGTNLASNGETSEAYISSNSAGVCFNHLLAAAQGTVTVNTLKSQC